MPEVVKNHRPPADRREIRVFISSTFRDMQEEREELVKRIFPQLRRLCESRGVTWGEVDLRWGVPDEAKAEGTVLPLCLQEIEHCRPYFIGLLGERHGWVPEEIPESLFETQPWLREHLHQSVTALEIIQVVDYLLEDFRLHFPPGFTNDLGTTVAALNNRANISILKTFPELRDQPPIALDVLWQTHEVLTDAFS